jgi:GxxExxY protein
MIETEIKAISDKVRQTAYDIHVYLGHGHLEKVYENALLHRLRKAGINAKQQFPLRVCDEDGTVLGEYFADLFVEDVLVIEIKVARALGVEHEAQLIGYLRSAKLEHGLLINFGAPLFEIRKYALSKPRGTAIRRR